MKQRLGIAQTLISNPSILIFDEPTAGLDPRERIRFRNIITSLSNDKIVIICTHIVPDIDAIADKAVMLKNGCISAIDSPNDICNALCGKMWEVKTEFNDLEALTNKLKVHSVSRDGDKYILRVYSETKPSDKSTETTVTLEDAYLHYFNEEDSNAFSL